MPSVISIVLLDIIKVQIIWLFFEHYSIKRRSNLNKGKKVEQKIVATLRKQFGIVNKIQWCCKQYLIMQTKKRRDPRSFSKKLSSYCLETCIWNVKEKGYVPAF